MSDEFTPRLIDFPRIGKSSLGYISVLEKDQLPFPAKRIYWTYFTPQDVERGNHAHYELEQILIAVVGKIVLNLETVHGEKITYVLESPDKGVLIPKLCWHTMQYSHNAVQMCIASTEYNEPDYIRNYEDFQKLIRR